MKNYRVLTGNCLELLQNLPSDSVHCCVTSPPYWGLRAYGTPPQIWSGQISCSHKWDENNFCTFCKAWKGELGQEPSPNLFVSNLVQVFDEVKRVLRPDGTLWLNISDTYMGSWGNYGNRPELDGKEGIQREKNTQYFSRGGWDNRRERPPASKKIPGFKDKDLIGIPWRLAFALQSAGWFLQSDIIWSKSNPMPESVRDRPTKSHEYVFLLSKSEKYFYDSQAIEENGKCKSDVWHVQTSPFKAAHFAVFPPRLIEPCILAGTSSQGCCRACKAPWIRSVTNEFVPSCSCGRETVPCTVLDPFCGAGTTGIVSLKAGRNFLGLELNPDYVELSIPRLEQCLN